MAARPSAPPPAPDRDAAPSTRDRLMDAALAQLTEHGVLGGLNLRQIADRVGVTPANIYHYFGSGRGLLRAALTRESRRLTEPLEVAADLPFAERRLAMFDEINRIPELRLGALLALDDDPDYEPLPFAAATFAQYRAQVDAGDLSPELDLVAAHLVPLATSVGVAIFRDAAARQLGLDVDELTRRARDVLETMLRALVASTTDATDVTGATGATDADQADGAGGSR